MNTSGNSRYKETEVKIQTAFLSLLESKSIHSISVNAICTSAHISRPTFYTHYEDINDLILKIEYEKSSYISSLLATQKQLSEEDFTNYLNYIKENKNFYIAYFRSENNIAISQSMMNQYLEANQLNANPALTYHMLFFMSGLKSIVYHWLIRNCPESVEELSQILFTQYLLFAT